MNSPVVTGTSLEDRIRSWIDSNPHRADAGERMLEQLKRIRSDFQGASARRLEALVAETLDRQLRIDASRQASLRAAERLSQSVRELTESLQACLRSATRANNALINTAIQSVQAGSSMTSEPPRLRRIDKKLLN